MNPETMALLQALMLKQQQGQQGQQDDAMSLELAAADAMGPEGMRQMTALGTAPDRMALQRDVYGQQAGQLQGDVARGRELQDKRFGNSGSALGNALGGMGDVLNSFRGGMMEKSAQGGLADALKRHQEGQAGMLDSQDDARTKYTDARLEAMRRLFASRQQPQQPQQPSAPYYLAKP